MGKILLFILLFPTALLAEGLLNSSIYNFAEFTSETTIIDKSFFKCKGALSAILYAGDNGHIHTIMGISTNNSDVPYVVIKSIDENKKVLAFDLQEPWGIIDKVIIESNNSKIIALVEESCPPKEIQPSSPGRHIQDSGDQLLALQLP